MELREERVTANDVEFAYLTAGPADGPLALCLHGFPDSAWTWRHLAPVLADAGFRVVAPWLRGYAPTAVPADGRYQSGALAADADGLHEALGGDDRAVIIGHDWGALAGYGAAAHSPDRWNRLVTVAVPPPAFAAAGFFDYDQIRRSFYMFVFQTPLAEGILGADDMSFIDRLWADWSPGYDATEDLELLKPSLREPDNLSAAIGYYRALLGGSPPDPALADYQDAAYQPIPQPTLYLHGATDGCMGPGLARGAEAQFGPGSRVQIVDGVGHFLHLERPDVVNQLIVDHLTVV